VVPTREPARVHAVVSSSGSGRRLARLDPADEAAYRHAVGRLVPAIEGSLGSGVMANRVLGRGALEWASLEPWRPARRAFNRALGRLATRGDVTLIDVRCCYRSIEPPVVGSCLDALPRADVAGVIRLLRRFEDDGVRGLPVGPEPSAILANAVLSEVDRAIRRTGARHIRWVDDIALVARGDAGRALALEAAAEALDALGLALNARKTRILLSETLRRSASAFVVSSPHPGALP
jgi:hypothetical protein